MINPQQGDIWKRNNVLYKIICVSHEMRSDDPNDPEKKIIVFKLIDSATPMHVSWTQFVQEFTFAQRGEGL